MGAKKKCKAVFPLLSAPIFLPATASQAASRDQTENYWSDSRAAKTLAQAVDLGSSLSVLIYVTDRLKSVPLLAFHRNSLSAAQRVEVELQVPLLVRPDHLIPGHLAARVSRRSTEDRGQCALGALFGFIVELAGFDAFDQRLHLSADRGIQVDLAGVNPVARLLSFLNLVEND